MASLNGRLNRLERALSPKPGVSAKRAAFLAMLGDVVAGTDPEFASVIVDDIDNGCGLPDSLGSRGSWGKGDMHRLTFFAAEQCWLALHQMYTGRLGFPGVVCETMMDRYTFGMPSPVQNGYHLWNWPSWGACANCGWHWWNRDLLERLDDCPGCDGALADVIHATEYLRRLRRAHA